MTKAEVLMQEARESIAQIIASLPDHIDPQEISQSSRLPFRAASIRDITLHRVADLGAIAIELYERKKSLAGAVLTRSIFESTAILFLLLKKVTEVIRTREIGEIDSFMMKVLFGCKDRSGPLEAVNVLTALGHLDKEFPGLKEI